jgi:uncharacterized protein involved in exopolysaccharide biosynthesis
MSESQVIEPPQTDSSNAVQDEGIDILDFLIVLARSRRLIAFVSLGGLLFGAIVAYLILKPTFTATATIMPPQQQQSSASSLLGQLGSLAALGGGGGLLKNPADMYVGMIMSRTVADRMIDRFHLQARYKTKTMDDTRKIFKSQFKVEVAKDGLIEISVKDTDPRRASDIANGLIDALYYLTSHLAITEAAQRRLFFNQQLDEEKTALASAEEDLKKTQEKTGLIQLSGQAEEIIRNVASLRAQIVSREVEMQSLRTYATDQNPDVTRLGHEIDALQQQLNVMENNQRKMQPGDIQVPTGQVPEAGLEYARKLREVTYHSTLLALLSKEYAAARIDEAKSAPLIQVVDYAVPPDRKSGPPRVLIVIGSGLLALLIGCLGAFVRHILVQLRQVPENVEKLDELRSVLGRRPLSGATSRTNAK